MSRTFKSVRMKQLMDKLRESGMDSLSSEERTDFFHYPYRFGNQRKMRAKLKQSHKRSNKRKEQEQSRIEIQEELTDD